MSKLPLKKLSHVPSIDGVRAIGSLLILLAHWNPKHFNGAWVVLGTFFLLSGFLIGRILQFAQDQPFKEYYGNYFINRCLRILPLYYLSLVIIYGLMHFLKDTSDKIGHAWDHWTDYFYYVVFYGINFIHLSNYDSKPDAALPFFGHYWSLSVEEQFYLLFPFLIFFVRGKKLKAVFIVMILSAPFIRYFSTVFLEQLNGIRWARIVTYEVTLFWLDAFAMGAALTFFDFSWIKRPRLLAYFTFAFTICFGLMIYYISYTNGYKLQIQNLGADFQAYQGKLSGIWIIDYRFVFMGFLFNLSSAMIVLCAVLGKPIAKFLDHKYVVFIGKRTYAMYVFHLPILILLRHYEVIDNHKILTNPIYSIIGFILFSIVTIFIAHISYEYFEKRFFKLKRRYV